MRGLKISLCLAVLLCFYSGAEGEELIFFADDSYKVLGSPELSASPLNPVLQPGEDELLRVSLSNSGRIEELIPLQANSSSEDVALEMAEELLSVDAQNLSARLQSDSSLQVSSGPEHIDYLPSGSTVQLEFSIAVPANASGWHDLSLLLDYERQVDVSVKDGVVSPLYQPDNRTIPLKMMVEGSISPLRIAGTKAMLSPGEDGTIMAAIENCGQETLRNCTLRLATAPPFSDEGKTVPVGDIRPGEIKVAELDLQVSRDASSQEYQLTCAVYSEGKEILLPLPVLVENGSGLRWFYFAAAILLVLGGGMLAIRSRILRQRRSKFKAR
jgi:uncharacterized membrane protein